MKKDLEDYLWNQISYNDEFLTNKNHRFPRDVIQEMIEMKMIHSPKQAWATLDKWGRKGLYEYGCCSDLGWKVRKQDDEPSI